MTNDQTPADRARELLALLSHAVNNVAPQRVGHVLSPKNAFADVVVLVGGRTFYVHPKSTCEPPCPVHAPSDHSLRDSQLLWRGDRYLFERECAHGVGHPDPDSLAYKRRVGAPESGVHGCCEGFCCRPVAVDQRVERARSASLLRHPSATTSCSCACNSGGFCGGCGHAGCGRR